MANKKKTYEAMFLLDPGTSDFQAASEPIRTVLERSEAETLSIKPWEERRLAYEIQGRKRCLYALTYFNVDPANVSEIEHDCQLNEQIIRVMILQKDQVSQDELATETPAEIASVRAEAAVARREALEEEALAKTKADTPPDVAEPETKDTEKIEKESSDDTPGDDAPDQVETLDEKEKKPLAEEPEAIE